MHPQQKKELDMLRRREIRKQTHCATERKRREQTNECFEKLRQIVPFHSDSNETRLAMSKLTILEKCISRLTELEAVVAQYESSIAASKIQSFSQPQATYYSPPGSPHPSEK
ncbi:hypothetical protein BC833DRAFT_565988, partial [Globomyces pollinis-pini]